MINCKGNKPYCSYYDIENYQIIDNSFNISLVNDCMPHALRACSPYLNVSIPKDSLKQYLNKISYKLLFEQNYSSKKGIEKLLLNKKTINSLSNNMFLFGKINNIYPFTMAINLSKTNNNVNGYYYYDNEQKKIKLKGTYSNGKIELNEYYNKQKTGSFILELNSEYNRESFSIYRSNKPDKYLSGLWSNFTKTKKYKIKFTEIKITESK